MTLRRHWLQQAIGGLTLMFIAWAFLNTADDKSWKVALSLALGLAAFGLASWLVASNFTAALRMPAPRLLRVAGCVLALVLILTAMGYLEESSAMGRLSAWVSSAVALKLKKPLAPARVVAVLGWTFFTLRWIVLPFLSLAFIARAAAVRTVPHLRLAAIYVAAFLTGAVLPHYLVHWEPKVHGFGPQAASALARFLIGYLMLITAWVMLGRSVRAADPT